MSKKSDMASLNISYPPNGFEKTKINAPNTLILNNNLATKSRVDARGHFYLRKKMEAPYPENASYNERMDSTNRIHYKYSTQPPKKPCAIIKARRKKWISTN